MEHLNHEDNSHAALGYFYTIYKIIVCVCLFAHLSKTLTPFVRKTLN